MIINKKLLLYLFLALSVRLLIVIFAENNFIFRNLLSNSISVVYERSAYLKAYGYKYSQTLPGSQAYIELRSQIDSINKGFIPQNLIVPNEGLYNTMHYPPGYSTIGSVLFLIFKAPFKIIMQAFGMIMDCLSIIILYNLCKVLFPHSKIIHNWSCAIYAVYPPTAFGSVSITPESTTIFLVLLMSYLFLISYDKDKSISLNTFLIGILNGLNGYLRSDLILFPFFLSLLFLSKKPLKEAVIRLSQYNFLTLIITVLMLSPWGYRNKDISGEFKLTSSALGGTLVTGLGSFKNPWQLGPSDYDRVKEAKSVGIQKPFEYEGDKYFKNRFLFYIKDDPLFTMKILFYRAINFIAAPSEWGFKKSEIRFSKIRNNGEILKSFKLLITKFTPYAISSFLSVISFFILIILIINKKNQVFTQFLLVNYLHTLVTHVPIHFAINYAFPLIFCNIILICFMIENHKNLISHIILKK